MLISFLSVEPWGPSHRPTDMKPLAHFLLPALVGVSVLGACGGDSGTTSTTSQAVSGAESAATSDSEGLSEAAYNPTPHDCEGQTGAVTDVAHEPAWRQHAAYQEWTDKSGCRVRIDVLAERSGPEHCGWESASVLITGKPLGERYTTVADKVEYVRDPDSAFGRPELTEGLDLDAPVPAEATDTGFRRGDVELWTVAGDDSAVWLVEPGGAERWPAGDTPGCA